MSRDRAKGSRHNSAGLPAEGRAGGRVGSASDAAGREQPITMVGPTVSRQDVLGDKRQHVHLGSVLAVVPQSLHPKPQAADSKVCS